MYLYSKWKRKQNRQLILSKMNKFNLTDVEKLDEWNKFVEKSPQGTIFSTSDYLQACGKKFKLYYVCKGSIIWAGVCLILSDDEKSCETNELVIYGGIMFEESVMPKETRAKIEKFNITEFVIEELDKKYNKIEMMLAPNFEDMRPFLWHNYHKGEKFKLDLRYTNYLNISDFTKNDAKESSVWNNLIKIRRSEIKKAEENKAKLSLYYDLDLFMNFFKSIFKDPSLEEKLKRIKNLVSSLIKKKKAVMFCLKEKDETISYIVVYCFDNKRAYLLFAAGNPDLNISYKGTMAYWESLKTLAKLGIQEVDLEGVNSPQRGWFKLSFGGDLKSYYKVYK